MSYVDVDKAVMVWFESETGREDGEEGLREKKRSLI